MILKMYKIMEGLPQMKSTLSISGNTFIALLFSIIVLFPLCANASDKPVVEIAVRKGDTLTGICKKHLTDPHQWREIAHLNRIKNPDFISAYNPTAPSFP
jgi:nucleoid-associated protein YgaU